MYMYQKRAGFIVVCIVMRCDSIAGYDSPLSVKLYLTYTIINDYTWYIFCSTWFLDIKN